MAKLVSIIVPNFNGEKYIRKTLDSIAAQLNIDFEALVVDDGSTDGSAQLVADYAAKDPRFVLFRLPGNMGAACTRNFAIRRSKGRFLAFLDADDLWNPGKLEFQINAMLKADAAMSCTAVHVVDAEGAKIGERRIPEIIGYSTLLKTTPIVNSSVVVDTEKVGRLEMPEIVRRQDLAMWLKIIRMRGPALGINQTLGSYRVHECSLSRNKKISALYTWKVIREIEKLPLFPALYYFSFYAVGGLARRLRGLN